MIGAERIRVALVAGMVLLAGGGSGVTPAAAQVGWTGEELTLEQAIRLSLERNRELVVAREELAGAEGQVREAWSAVYPSVTANATYTRNIDVPVQFLPAQFFDPDAPEGEQALVRFGADNMWVGQLRLEQPVFQAAAFIGVGAAARYRGLQEEVVRGRSQEIVTRTKERYFDVLLAAEAERLNQESLERVRKALADTRAMHRAGMVGDYDVLRLEVELANLEPQLRRSGNATEAAIRSLGVQLGLEEIEGVRVAGSLLDVEVSEAELESAPLVLSFGVAVGPGVETEELMVLARQNRSELRQLRATEDLRIAELRVEQSEYLPKVSFFANYMYQGQADGAMNPFGFGGAHSATTPQVGLQVSVPLFNGFRRPARVDQRRASVRQVEAQHRQVLAEVENQVRTLHDRVEEARLRAEAQRVARAQAQRGFEIANVQFREGLGTRLELMDAELALRQSEFNSAEAVHDYLTARARLDHAAGTVPEVR